MALLSHHWALPSSPNGPSMAELFLRCKICLAYEVDIPPSKNTTVHTSEECLSSPSPAEDCRPVTMTDTSFPMGWAISLPTLVSLSTQ